MILAIIAVLISAFKSLSEIIAVVFGADIVAVIADGGVLITERILIIKSPAVAAVCLPCVVALLVTILNGLTEHLGTILTRVVGLVVAVIPIIIIDIIVVLGLLKSQLVLPQTLPITLLVLQVGISTLLLQTPQSVIFDVLPIAPTLVILAQPLLPKLLELLAVVLLIPLIIRRSPISSAL